METVLTMLLIRFGLIVGGLVVLALVVFAVALVLRRRGKLDSTRERVAPLARGVAQLLADRAGQPRDSQYDDSQYDDSQYGDRQYGDRDFGGRGGGRGSGGGIGGDPARAAARYLADDRGRGGRRR